MSRRLNIDRTYVRCIALPYIELHAHSAFSFLDGASAPEELAERAAELDHPALALTDHDGLCGSLAFAHAARDVGVRSITGCEIRLSGAWVGAHLATQGDGLVCLTGCASRPQSRALSGYGVAAIAPSIACSAPVRSRPTRDSVTDGAPVSGNAR